MDAEVGCRGWTQRLNAEVGRRVLDTDVGCKGWKNRLAQRLDDRGWTQRLGA